MPNGDQTSTLASEPRTPAPARAAGTGIGRTGVLLGVVLLSGAALRLSGLDWGLPLQLHADERVVVEGAIDLATRNSFEPTAFSRPDHLEIQLSYLAYELYGHLLHGTPPELLYARDEAPFYQLSRLVTALLGVLCIPVAFLIGRRFSRAAGVLGAAAVAFFPPYVTHSHYATPDVPLVLACLLAILACVRYIERPGWLWLAAGSFAVSLGVTAKYPAAVAGVVVATSVLVAGLRDRTWGRTLAHLVAAPFLFLVGVFVLSPGLLTNFTAVRGQLVGQNSTGHLGADGLGFFETLVFYARDGYASWGFLMTVLAAAGVVTAVRRRWLHAVPLGLGFLMWVALSTLTLHWARWGLPMYVSVLLLAPLGAVGAFDWLRSHGRTRRYAVPVTAVALTLALGNLAVSSVAALAAILSPDTRAVAMADFAARRVTSQNTIFEGYTPLLPAAPLSVFDSFVVQGGTLEVDPAARKLVVRHEQVVETRERAADTAEYVTISSGMYGRYLREPRYAAEQRFYRLLEEQFPQVRRWSAGFAMPTSTAFEPVNMVQQASYVLAAARGETRSGPTVVLYRIPRTAR